MNKLTASISAIIPVYNEEGYLPQTIREVYKLLNDHFYDFEIIFIDDGSRDESPFILENFQKEYTCVKVLYNNSHQGLGTTLRKGFSAASKEVIFYIDCDLPTSPDFLLKAISLLDAYDIIIGRRDKWDGFFRKSCSLFYNYIIQLLFAIDYPDVNFGAKVFKRAILNKIKLYSRLSFIDAEFIVEAARNGFSIKSMPCLYQKRLYGRSKLFTLNNFNRSIIEMFNYYFNHRLI